MSTEIEKAAGTKITFFIPDTESLGTLQELEPQFSLNLKYKTADDWAVLKDQPLRAFYMGTKEVPNENQEVINCAVFVTEKECFIAGQMTLFESVKNLAVKTPVEITYKGKKNNKSTDGTTMIFDVVKLG